MEKKRGGGGNNRRNNSNKKQEAGTSLHPIIIQIIIAIHDDVMSDVECESKQEKGGWGASGENGRARDKWKWNESSKWNERQTRRLETKGNIYSPHHHPIISFSNLLESSWWVWHVWHSYLMYEGCIDGNTDRHEMWMRGKREVIDWREWWWYASEENEILILQKSCWCKSLLMIWLFLKMMMMMMMKRMISSGLTATFTFSKLRREIWKHLSHVYPQYVQRKEIIIIWWTWERRFDGDGVCFPSLIISISIRRNSLLIYFWDGNQD